MSKKTIADYYKFYSQDWRLTEDTLWSIIREDKRVTELKELYTRDKANNNDPKAIDARVATMLYLILHKEHRELEVAVDKLERENAELQVLRKIEERAPGSDFAVGVVKVLLMKIQEWKEILLKADTLRSLVESMEETSETVIEMVKRVEK